MMPFPLRQAVIAALALAVGAADGRAQGVSGILDPTFGNGGTVTTDFIGPATADNLDCTFSGTVKAAVQVPGNQIILAGSVLRNSVWPQSSRDFALAAYDLNGTPIPNFGRAGKITTDFADLLPLPEDDVLAAVAAMPDGRIVAAGTIRPNFADGSCGGGGGNGFFGVARYLPTGDLDLSFGTGGRAIYLDLTGIQYAASAVAVTSDGKIIVAGLSVGAAAQVFAMCRFNADGTTDTAFGSKRSGDYTIWPFG